MIVEIHLIKRADIPDPSAIDNYVWGFFMDELHEMANGLVDIEKEVVFKEGIAAH
ncbi:MAG: hypothetical protein S4CHLAM102_11190 [Chlamydiia bacterium]|nr:hypothetical protein [Chlamydiia bacterium]